MVRGGSPQHPDYVLLGRIFKGVRVVAMARCDLVGLCWLVTAESRFVCVEVGGVRIGGVYGKCGKGVHGIAEWLAGLR